MPAVAFAAQASQTTGGRSGWAITAVRPSAGSTATKPVTSSRQTPATAPPRRGRRRRRHVSTVVPARMRATGPCCQAVPAGCPVAISRQGPASRMIATAVHAVRSGRRRVPPA